MALTIAASFGSVAISRMKVRSIFSVSIGSWRRLESYE
jgi:hypothetical protein